MKFPEAWAEAEDAMSGVVLIAKAQPLLPAQGDLSLPSSAIVCQELVRRHIYGS
jgi:hypothetical protein